MTDRELMQMALDVLEYIATQTRSVYSAEKAIEALRARLAQPEPEPEVGVCCQDYDSCIRSCTPRGQWIAHKAAQREWQSLTDEEITACIQMGKSGYLDGFVKPLATSRAVEAKLKEKNT